LPEASSTNKSWGLVLSCAHFGKWRIGTLLNIFRVRALDGVVPSSTAAVKESGWESKPTILGTGS